MFALVVVQRVVHQELYVRSRRGIVLREPNKVFICIQDSARDLLFLGGLVCLFLFTILYFLGIQASLVILLGCQASKVQ